MENLILVLLVSLLVGSLVALVGISLLMVTLREVNGMLEKMQETLGQFTNMTQAVSQGMQHFGESLEGGLSALRNLEAKVEEGNRRIFRRPKNQPTEEQQEPPEKWTPDWKNG